MSHSDSAQNPFMTTWHVKKAGDDEYHVHGSESIPPADKMREQRWPKRVTEVLE